MLTVLLLLATPAPVPVQAASPTPAMPELVHQYEADRGALRRRWDVPLHEAALDRMLRLHERWLQRLAAYPFEDLDGAGRVDWILLRQRIEHEMRQGEHERRRLAEVAPLIPFHEPLVALCAARRAREWADPAAAARTLHDSVAAIERARTALEEKPPEASRAVATRAARQAERLRRALRDWFRFYDEYHPMFGWWVQQPWEEASAALEQHAEFLRREIAGLDPDEDGELVGDPIGREALLAALEREMIPYSPEELIAIGERELAWCRERMLAASQELGFGDDWRAAQDHVKSLHVAPGEQPELIRRLSDEAVAFLRERELITIPPLADEVWRMEMMPPRAQEVTPYFTGGEVIRVSFPTAGMEHEDKLMSMRGNNVHFSRATVHHELIPGHHLQGFMARRWNTHRRAFRTPFLVEGWALYWEMRLWDLGFPQGPEDRVGMLFWRTHRCARILFSLNFHLGNWTPEECVDFLVENVGHERRNAEAEVRRSIQGGYGPLYQCAYMVGGLQMRALHRELVEAGEASERAFHDAVLRQNSIPVEMIRAALTGQELSRDFRSSWRFDDA